MQYSQNFIRAMLLLTNKQVKRISDSELKPEFDKFTLNANVDSISYLISNLELLKDKLNQQRHYK